MKEMEAKTENRYEYRKPQEKRKQMIAPDLFEFAYVPDWYGHLAELERLALPESWKFRKPSRETKNADTPILECYIHTIFRKQVIDFNSESDPRKADSIFHLENECVCFHTGLYTPQYKGIYGYFERNNFSDSLRDWYFRGFCDELSPKLRYIEPLPQKPVYHMAQSGINFNPEWPIRVNVNHILGDEENLERIPAKIRKVKNLPLLFETAVELGRRKSVIEPGLVVPQGYQGRVQYLLPVYLTNMQKPDLAMTLTVMDGYYLGNTCLTLEMLYDSSGTLIYDIIEPDPMGVVLKNNGEYFIGTVIDLETKTVQSLVCDRSTGDVFKTAIRSFTGELNPSCTADIVMGMYADSYYFAGGFDDWFYETDSDLTIDDLEAHFLFGLLANGADVDSSVDAISNPGSVTLKQTDGVYVESGVLYTRILDLEEGGLAGEGKIQLVGTVDAGITFISEVKTRTSDSLEGASFSDWEAVGTDGVIQSPNLRYIQIQMTLSTTDTSMTPELTAIQIYETPKAPYSKLGYARPVVLSDSGIREAVLENAYDIIVTSELNGSDYLEFSIPFKDGKRSYLDNEKKLQITKDIYRIRTVTDDKGEDGNTVTSIYAEAAFYDLAYSEKKSEQTYEAETAEKPMAYALQGTGWSVGKITVSTKRSWQSTDKNALSMLRTIQSIYGGDLEFDNVNKQVSLLTQSGNNSGAVFAYRKNMKSIQRVVDTRSLVTRLYAYGADGMTFASINNGKEYVENTEYSSEIRVSTLDCSSFTNPYQMLEYTEMRLADYSKPSISYVIQVMDLSVLTGWEHESFGIGDVVTVDDKDLGIRISTRIIRMNYNVQEPWKTVIELSTKLKELGDSSASWEKAADTLSSSDLLDRQEMKDLVVNNHLLNSKADDGFSYWQNSGFEVDGENGASGNASFKCVGALNTTKTLSQEVYPATRSSYTVSASIATENLKKGANGRVGIELVIEYEDGSEETRFVELY